MTMKNNKKINVKYIDEENDIKRVLSTTTMTLAKRQHLKIIDNYRDETIKHLLFPTPFLTSVLYCKDEANQSASLSEEKRTAGNAAFAKKQASASILAQRSFGPISFQRGRKKISEHFLGQVLYATPTESKTKKLSNIFHLHGPIKRHVFCFFLNPSALKGQ
jgi:hypothetical protein